MRSTTTRLRPPLNPRDVQAEQAIDQGYTLARNPVCPRCREQASVTGHCACD